MKVIIIILQAILNLVRKRRDLIANINKIPPEFRDAVVAWYSPKKQKLTNYDVIESYSEDFTKWTKNGNITSAVTVNNNSIVINGSIKSASIFKKSNTSIQSINIIVSGVKNDDNIEYRYIKNGVLQYITIVNGINKLPASELTENPDFHIGFVLNINSTGIINLKQITTSILKDFSGNKHDAYLYGFQGKLNSGVGIYKVDFSKSQNANAFDNFERFNNKFVAKGRYNGNWSVFGQYTVDGIVKNKVTIKITGVSNLSFKLALQYGYFTKDSKYIQKEMFISKDGIYSYDINNIKIPDENNIAQTIYNRFYFDKEVINNVNLIVEEIPDYPNQLCYDGKSYAVVYDMPILTDYTVMAERTWFERQNRACFLSKITTSGTGAFGFEFYNEYNEDTTYSFGRVNNVEQFKDGITYQITNSYNGIVKLDYIVNGKDNAELYIGKLRLSEHTAFIGCHGDILLFNRSLTDDELDLVKEYFFGIVRIKDALLTVDGKPIITTDNKYIKLNKK